MPPDYNVKYFGTYRDWYDKVMCGLEVFKQYFKILVTPGLNTALQLNSKSYQLSKMCSRSRIRMRYAGHTESMRATKNTYHILVWKSERSHFAAVIRNRCAAVSFQVGCEFI